MREALRERAGGWIADDDRLRGPVEPTGGAEPCAPAHLPPSRTGSFEDFADQTLPSLVAYAVILTDDRELAADVVQDVMVRVHLRWRRISGTQHPRAYVRRMITNEYLSWRRRWHVRHVVAVHDHVLDDRASTVDDPGVVVAERDALVRMVARLPPKQRATIVLRYYEDLDDVEIAEVMGTSVQTVRSNASRGLATLRRSTTGRPVAPARAGPEAGAANARTPSRDEEGR